MGDIKLPGVQALLDDNPLDCFITILWKLDLYLTADDLDIIEMLMDFEDRMYGNYK